MRRIHIFLFATLTIIGCSSPNETYVRNAIQQMDRKGLYAEGEEWEAMKKEALSQEPETLEEAQAIINKAAKVAGGKHSYLLPADKAQAREKRSNEEVSPTVTIREDGICIIHLPAFAGDDENCLRYARTVLDSISDTVKGVCIDLRGNHGGNMYPMIAAVHRFLPDDILLKFKMRRRFRSVMPINKEFVANLVGVEIESRINCPVAILTDEETASSGEAVLLCFRGLDNVRVFGSPTAGYASANESIILDNGSILALTVSCDIARTDEIFCDDPIVPDVETESPEEDALLWLKENIK
ncbi:MAG: S41 family peptidase [Bacteroidales bacterium]|nr:S41 family peptidase [Bacteroidales bacterium]